jgi:hypothetical protein
MRGRGRALVLSGHEDLPLDQLERLLEPVFAEIAPLAATAEIDGFSDCAQLPEHVRHALARIRALAPPRLKLLGRASEPTYMAIQVDLTEPAIREAAITFAPYSIHARFLASDGTELAVFDDTSTGVWFDSQLADVLRVSLAAPLSVSAL